MRAKERKCAQTQVRKRAQKAQKGRKKKKNNPVKIHWEIKGRFPKRVVLANVPSFRFSFRGNIRRNHPFGNHPFRFPRKIANNQVWNIQVWEVPICDTTENTVRQGYCYTCLVMGGGGERISVGSLSFVEPLLRIAGVLRASQRAQWDIWLPRGKNCRGTIFAPQIVLPLNYPHHEGNWGTIWGTIFCPQMAYFQGLNHFKGQFEGQFLRG